MTLSENWNSWGKPTFKIVIALLLVTIWLYVAGAILLYGIGLDSKKTTLFSYIQYATYYSDNKMVGNWLFLAAIGATLLLLLPLAAFKSKQKAYTVRPVLRPITK